MCYSRKPLETDIASTIYQTPASEKKNNNIVFELKELVFKKNAQNNIQFVP